MLLKKNPKLEELQQLEDEVYLKDCLPHLFGMKLYPWAYDYIESENRMNYLCAANQISKSSTNIRKCIKWATEPEGWKRWPSRPTQFWYMYPSQRVATSEFHEKWVKEWLPRGEFKDHPVYGWKEDIQQKQIVCIRFNSGVTVYFKSYQQSETNLQTSSVHAIFADEEMPEDLYSEIIVRTSGATIQGHFHMVFTATIGQEFWREVIEEKGHKERFPEAAKWQISMYDCLSYRDGSQSPWTLEKIEEQKKRCKSDAEIQRRIYGRFVLDEGLKYESYSKRRNFVAPYKIPGDWLHFVGIDVGSGGAKGHPGAICFVAVRPDFKKGAVYNGWRGDGIDTTAGDIYMKFRMLKGAANFIGQYYDWQSKDFYNIQNRLGDSFQPAEKSHEIGEQVLNVLFKNAMLDIFDTQELRKLDQELASLKRDTRKTAAKDDFTDALRYSVTKIPWDFSVLTGDDQAVAAVKAAETVTCPRERSRLGLDRQDFQESLDVYASEIDEANSLMDYDW